MALRHERTYTYISNIKSNPKNRGDNTESKHTSYNLIAIAIAESIKTETGGCVSFHVKSSLIGFYEDKMGARQIGNHMMCIQGKASIALLERFKEGV